MNKPTTVHKFRAIAMARVFHHELGIMKPPIDAKKIVKCLARLFYFSDFHEEGFTVYGPPLVNYRVYINKDSPDGRISWTYAHEIGHIKLRHLEVYDCNNLNAHERWILDREANIFTSEFLMPKGLIKKYACPPICQSKLGELKNLFEVSWEALINRLDELGIQAKDEIIDLFENNNHNPWKPTF
jgi:hypothetical protein